MPRGVLRGFWKLTWLEAKIFTREPMGFVGTLVMPLVIFIVLGRAFSIGKPVAAPEVPSESLRDGRVQFRDRQGICAKNCLLQFGSKKNRVDDLGRGVRFIVVLISTHRIEVGSLLAASLFRKETIVDASQKIYLVRRTDLLQLKITMFLKKPNLLFT